MNIMKICVHGNKYEDCVFGCKLWEYSRMYRKHFIDDDKSYSNDEHWHLWQICSSAPMGQIQDKWGYDVYHKGSLIKHGKTVKELKQFVEKFGDR